MAAPVTVYGPVISPAVARVAACLLEKDVPFQIEPVDMSKGEHKSPSFLKLQPFGQVPAFKDHLTTVFGTLPQSHISSSTTAASPLVCLHSCNGSTVQGIRIAGSFRYKYAKLIDPQFCMLSSYFMKQNLQSLQNYDII